MKPADVPLHTHFEALRQADRRLMLVGAAGLIALGAAIVWGGSKATAIALDGERLARTVALDAANDKGAAHNGLIERMREMSSTYVTKANVTLLLGLALGWGGLAWSIFGRR